MMILKESNFIFLIISITVDSKFFLSQVDALFPKEFQKLKQIGIIPKDEHGIVEVLDIGCGPGHFSRRLLEQDKRIRVTCMDIDEKFVKYNEKILESEPKYISKFKPLHGSIFNTNLPSNHFDFVIARFVYQHLRNVKDVSNPIQVAGREVWRVLKDGGKFIAIDSDHNYGDIVEPGCESCGRITDKVFRYRKKLGIPDSYPNSGTELFRYLKVGGFVNIQHDAIFVSSEHFSDGIKKFLPMLYVDFSQQMVDAGVISQKLLNKAEKEIQDKYILKKEGEPKMSIVVFSAIGEKAPNSNDSSFLDKDEL